MNEEHTLYLVESYQPLYENRVYFACGDGWFNIIKDLSETINNIIIKNELSCRCSDVKEKYGTLRYYMDSETDEISEEIKKAEERSAKTCEFCGSPGNLTTAVWPSTLCERCSAKK